MQKQLLEVLFGQGWFASSRARNHSAYRRWTLCNQILERPGLKGAPVFEFANLVLDNYFLVKATHGHGAHFELGDLANYADAQVQRRIRSEIREARKFEDLLVEINYAAWHLLHGNQVRALSSQGHPDFEVVVPSLELPIAAECKRVQSDTSDNRFGVLVKNANKQIKRLEKRCIGLIVVDITERIFPRVIRLGERDAPEVERVCDLLRRSMHTHNTAVSAAIVTWRTVVTAPMTDGSGGTLYVLQQYSRVVSHANPVFALPTDHPVLDFGYGAGLITRASSPPSVTT